MKRHRDPAVTRLALLRARNARLAPGASSAMVLPSSALNISAIIGDARLVLTDQVDRLTAVLVLLAVLDVWTTDIGMARGFVEMNPVGRSLLGSAGTAGLILGKIVLNGGPIVLMRWLARSGDRDAVAIGRFALVIAVLIMTFIVGSNIVCLVAA